MTFLLSLEVCADFALQRLFVFGTWSPIATTTETWVAEGAEGAGAAGEVRVTSISSRTTAITPFLRTLRQ